MYLSIFLSFFIVLICLNTKILAVKEAINFGEQNSTGLQYSPQLSTTGYMYTLPDITGRTALAVRPDVVNAKYHVITNQGLRASSLQFTSPLEFNAIFRDGFTLRLDLTAGSKIHDPVNGEVQTLTIIVTCTLLCCDDVTNMALWNFQKPDVEP